MPETDKDKNYDRWDFLDEWARANEKAKQDISYPLTKIDEKRMAGSEENR